MNTSEVQDLVAKLQAAVGTDVVADPNWYEAYRADVAKARIGPSEKTLHRLIAGRFNAWLHGAPVTLQAADDFMSHCVDEGMGPANLQTHRKGIARVCRYIGHWEFKYSGILPVQQPKHRYYHPDEITAILDTAKRGTYSLSNRTKALIERNYDLLIVALYSGLRRKGLVNIMVRGCDFRRDLVTTLEKGDKFHPKGKQFTVPMHPKARAALLRRCEGKSQNESVFGLSPSALYDVIKRIARAAGVPDFHPHAARHVVATRMKEANRPIDEIGAVLGHANLRNTLIYVDCEDMGARASVNALD